MIEEYFVFFIDWVADHPRWTELIVFLVAMAESLAFIGLMIPGVVMMFAVGALVGSGILPFAPICEWAIAGAFTGDCLSFWIGRRFHAELKAFWPFRSYPLMIDRGIGFFRRFGGRSVLLGRFFGPVRGIIPMVAGMLGMPTGRFVAMGAVSAILWAPIYLVPGMAFGASLELASKVAGRLVFLIISLIIIFWLAIWFSKKIYWFLIPRAYRFVQFIFDWNKHHPLVAKLTNPVLDASQRDYFSLVIFGSAIFPVAAWVGHLVFNRPVVWFLITPWTDRLFQSISMLGSYPATAVLFLIVAGQLTVSKRFVALLHWSIGFAFCLIGVEASRFILNEAILDGYIVRSIVLFGFLAVLLAGSITVTHAWLIYALICVISLLVIFARIYLGLSSLSTAVIAALSAVAWTSVVGVGYRRHNSNALPFKSMVLALLLFIMGLITYIYHEFGGDGLEPDISKKSMSLAVWRKQGWRWVLPMGPDDSSRSSRPPNVQWSSPLTNIRSRFESQGWTEAPVLNLKNGLHWLSPDPDLRRTPPLPELIQNSLEVLILTKIQSASSGLILRIWSSQWAISETQRPIWIGRMERLSHRKTSALLRYPGEASLTAQEIIATVLALNATKTQDDYTLRYVSQSPTMILVSERP